ncbi:zinc finger, CCHC-type containing protein [Tanacetum coccineum]
MYPLIACLHTSAWHNVLHKGAQSSGIDTGNKSSKLVWGSVQTLENMCLCAPVLSGPNPSSFLINGTEDIGSSVVPKEDIEGVVVQQPKPQLRKSKRNRTPKNVRPEFKLYLTEETMYEIFKRKLKVDGTIEKFKVRLVIQGFRQKSEIDYFDTYAPVARIITIRLLIALALIRNLIIHQIDVKTTFLYDELDYVAYMSQPRGFIMPGNENKVCKLVKYLYGLKQAPKKRHQKFNEVVLSNGYLLNQADKFHVDLTKEFLSSRFSMKDMGEADVILVSTHMDRSKKLRSNNGQAVSQLEYSKIKKDTLMPVGSAKLKIIHLQVAGASTLAKAYSHMYNGKSRHLGVRYNMIRELIMNGVVSIEFVRSQQNLVLDEGIG